MRIKFDSGLIYQQDAINAIVDIFKGQETCTSNFTVYSPQFLAQQKTLDFNQIGYANKLQLTEAQILENTQKIQLRNGLRPSKKEEVDIKHLDYSIEMETGVGKTYVYLRTIMEMNRQYGFTKFIIVVYPTDQPILMPSKLSDNFVAKNIDEKQERATHVCIHWSLAA